MGSPGSLGHGSSPVLSLSRFCLSLSLFHSLSGSPTVSLSLSQLLSLSGPSLSLFSVSFDLPLSLTLCFTQTISRKRNEEGKKGERDVMKLKEEVSVI
jgi:hypothetical protein